MRPKVQQNFSCHKSMLSRLKPLEEVGSQIHRRIQPFHHHLKLLLFNGNQTNTLVDLDQTSFAVSCSSKISNSQRCSFHFAVPSLPFKTIHEQRNIKCAHSIKIMCLDSWFLPPWSCSLTGYGT